MRNSLKEKWLVCRVCLKQPKEKMQNIFDRNESRDMTKMLLDCGGVPIKQYDHFPDKICDKCYKYLRVAYKFRLNCQRSYKHLSRFIAPIDEENSINNNQDDIVPAETIDATDVPENLDLADISPDDPRSPEEPQSPDEPESPDDSRLQDDPRSPEDMDFDDLDNHNMKLEPGEIVDGVIEPDAECDNDNDNDGEASVDDSGIKREIDEYEVVDIYEPMEDEIPDDFEDDVDNEEFEDFDDVEYSEPGAVKAEYDDEDFKVDLSTSDDDFVPNVRNTQKRTVKRVKREDAAGGSQKAGTSRRIAGSATKKQSTGGARKRSNGVGRPSGIGKRGPKPKNRETYICDICGNVYPSQGRLTEHIKLHMGIKPHECEICGHCFAQTQQLARHMNTHTGNRPYKCSYCPAAFADLSTRNKHHRIHTNERPYVCDVCGKAFTYTNTLKFHKMIHTGEKPHVCDVCGKGFQQAYKMRNHRLTHEKKGCKLEKVEVETVVSYTDTPETYTQILEI